MKRNLSKAFVGAITTWALLAVMFAVRGESLIREVRDFRSSNQKFIARVARENEGLGPTRMIVSEVSPKGTNTLWQVTPLHGDRGGVPLSVFVSDDGASVIALNEFPTVGRGDAVAAIYSRKGILANYSLEQFAPPPNGAKGQTNRVSWGDPYHGRFYSNSEGRMWDADSIQFFYQEGSQLLFCLWLSWDNRWVSWRMSDGALRAVPPSLVQRLNQRARESSRRALQAGQSLDDIFAALSFLATLRLGEDRPLIERYLRNDSFYSLQGFRKEDSRVQEFEGVSAYRAAADRALCAWDGILPQVSVTRSGEECKFLGQFQCHLILGDIQSSEQSFISVCLIGERDLGSLGPGAHEFVEAYLSLDISEALKNPSIQTQSSASSKASIPIVIRTVNPGRYRVRVYRNGAERDGFRPKPPQLDKSELMSGEMPVVAIEPGKMITGIDLEVSKPVAKE